MGQKKGLKSRGATEKKSIPYIIPYTACPVPYIQNTVHKNSNTVQTVHYNYTLLTAFRANKEIFLSLYIVFDRS